jgi:hypothetical protein
VCGAAAAVVLGWLLWFLFFRGGGGGGEIQQHPGASENTKTSTELEPSSSSVPCTQAISAFAPPTGGFVAPGLVLRLSPPRGGVLPGSSAERQERRKWRNWRRQVQATRLRRGK